MAKYSFRMSDEYYDRLSDAATKAGMSINAWLLYVTSKVLESGEMTSPPPVDVTSEADVTSSEVRSLPVRDVMDDEPIPQFDRKRAKSERRDLDRTLSWDQRKAYAQDLALHLNDLPAGTLWCYHHPYEDQPHGATKCFRCTRVLEERSTMNHGKARAALGLPV